MNLEVLCYIVFEVGYNLTKGKRNLVIIFLLLVVVFTKPMNFVAKNEEIIINSDPLPPTM